MNGLLVVDKPSGPTSHDVVARVRRTLGTRRIGHTGTLDPLATGVLVLVVGQATRLAQFLAGDGKEYVADVRFGTATATYDAAGLASPPLLSVAGPLPSTVDLPGLDDAVNGFRGTYPQTPPPYSAKKVGGTRAYTLARAGVATELKPVQVTVSAIEIVERGAGTVRLRVACSAGFYVRTLAHELGQRMGCGAHLVALRRTRAGSFDLAEAVTLDDVERAGPSAVRWLQPLDRVLPDFPALVLSEAGARRARHGNVLSSADFAPGQTVESWSRARSGGRGRLIDPDGVLLGIAELEPAGLLHPIVVLV